MFGWPLRHRTGFVIETGQGGKPVTRCALLVGINPQPAVLRLWKSVMDAKRLGAKIIVVDPRYTKTAELADIWLQIRPGTDTALLMSMIQVVIEENLYDKEFVEKWCYGFDKVAARVKEYTPDKAAAITGVPAEKIIEAARVYATEKPGISIHGMGMEHIENNQEAIQARLILTAITGNLDVKGGDALVGPGPCVSEPEMQLGEMLSPEQRKKQLGADKFKLLSWPGRELIWEQNLKHWGRISIVIAYANLPSVLRAMVTGKPYPVKAGMTIASNPLITQANVKLVYKALKSLDLYVVKDYWMTPCALIADYVLPTACWLERPDLLTGGETDRRVIAGEAALPAKVPGEHEYWTDYEYFKELGRRMGQGEYWKWDTLEEVTDYQLAPLGSNLREFMDQHNGLYWPPDEYKKYEKTGFGTPTGKVELYSTILEKLDYDPLPRYEEPKEGPVSRPDLLKEYPYQLITGGRFPPYFHSEHRQIPSIRAKRPEPLVQVHPDTARKLGISDGDWIWIETIRGRVRQKCTYFDGIKPDVVHAEHGWWFPELPGEEPWLAGLWESNINVVMGDELERCNPKSGGWPLKTALCRIYKCKTY